MKSSKLMLLALLIPATLILGSCSSREDKVIVEFKDRKITVADFERAYKRVDPNFLPKTRGFEGKLEFLNTLTNKEVMAYMADQLGYDKDPQVLEGMEAYRRMGLQLGYLKKRVLDVVKVTEEDIKRHYDNEGVTLAVKQILVDTPDEADQAYTLLENGESFESVCQQFSVSEDAANGGQIVTLTYGRLSPDFQIPVFEKAVGEYTEPIFSPYGYFIVKVLKRTEPRKRKPYEEEYERCKFEIKGQMDAIRTNEVSEEVRKEHGVTWYYDGLRICFNALPPDRPLDNAPRRQDEIYPLLYFDSGDFDKLVVTYMDKEIRVKDFSDFYDQASFYGRPRRPFRLMGIRTFLTERIMSDILSVVMSSPEVLEDPDIKRTIKNKQEEMMVNRLFEDRIKGETAINEKMIRNYYDDNLPSFSVPEKRRFGIILTSDFEKAKEAHAKLTEGEVFRNVVMKYTTDAETRRSFGETELLARGEQAELDDRGFSLSKVGEFTEPFEISRGWVILKLVERVPEHQTALDEVRPQIRANLEVLEQNRRLEESLAKWRDEVGVTINEGNLRKTEIVERSATDAPPEHQHAH